LYAAAGSPLALLLVRLSHGLGGGFVGPASMALVSDRADAARKGRAFAMYGISIAVAVILGFAVAGVASARGDLRAMFFGLAFALVVFAVVSVVVHYPSGMLSDRLGPHIPCILGLVAVSGAMGLLPSVTTFPTLLALMALFGLGHGLIFPSSSALATRHVRRESLGLATGVYFALLVTGVAVGAPLAGAMATAWTPAPAFLAIAVVAVISLAFLAPAALAGRETLRSPE